MKYYFIRSYIIVYKNIIMNYNLLDIPGSVPFGATNIRSDHGVMIIFEKKKDIANLHRRRIKDDVIEIVDAEGGIDTLLREKIAMGDRI